MKNILFIVLLIGISCSVFSIDSNNTVCFLGFTSSSDDPVITMLAAKANELIVNRFTISGSVSLVNLSRNNANMDSIINESNKNLYRYYIYGLIELSDSDYIFSLIRKNTQTMITVNHVKKISTVMETFSICDQLYTEILSDINEVNNINQSETAENITTSINAINNYKINEWLFNGSPKSEINSKYYLKGKLEYIPDRRGKESAAVNFSKTSHINKMSKKMDLYNDFTISIWFLLTDVSHNTHGRLYDCMQWEKKTGYNIICGQDSKIIYFSYFSEDGIVHDVMTNDELNLNQWYNVIVTFSNGISCLYLDGKLQKMLSSTNSITPSKRYISIGNGFDDYMNQTFHGSIDDISIFNKSLTAQEVMTLYQTF